MTIRPPQAPQPERVTLSAPEADSRELSRPDGATVRFDIFGTANCLERRPPVLFLDGLGQETCTVEPLLEALARKLPVISMYYRGHGPSPLPPQPWDFGLEALADDAAAVLETNWSERQPLVVAFSAGVQIALELYRRHRSAIGGMVLISGRSGALLRTLPGADSLAPFLPALGSSVGALRGLGQRLWSYAGRMPWTQLPALLAKTGTRGPLEALRHPLGALSDVDPELFLRLLEAAHRHRADDILPEIETPTLAIAARDDPFVPLAATRAMAFAIPDARWVVLEGQGHDLPRSQPELIAELILEQAARVANPPSDALQRS